MEYMEYNIALRRRQKNTQNTNNTNRQIPPPAEYSDIPPQAASALISPKGVGLTSDCAWAEPSSSDLAMTHALSDSESVHGVDSRRDLVLPPHSTQIEFFFFFFFFATFFFSRFNCRSRV